jgi:hypothetical protein
MTAEPGHDPTGTKPPPVPWWRQPYAYVTGDECRAELRKWSVIAFFGALGTGAFITARHLDWLDERDKLRYEFTAEVYKAAKEELSSFTRQIPVNVVFLEKITSLRLAHEEHIAVCHQDGTAVGECPASADRLCVEAPRAVDELAGKWVAATPHYRALCEGVVVTFDYATPDFLRQRYDESERKAGGKGTAAAAAAEAPTFTSIAAEADYLAAMFDLGNVLSYDVLGDNVEEFRDLYARRPLPAPEAGRSDEVQAVLGCGTVASPASGSDPATVALAQQLRSAVYGEIDEAYGRCSVDLHYGLRWHRVMRDYGLKEDD